MQIVLWICWKANFSNVQLDNIFLIIMWIELVKVGTWWTQSKFPRTWHLVPKGRVLNAAQCTLFCTLIPIDTFTKIIIKKNNYITVLISCQAYWSAKLKVHDKIKTAAMNLPYEFHSVSLSKTPTLHQGSSEHCGVWQTWRMKDRKVH